MNIPIQERRYKNVKRQFAVKIAHSVSHEIGGIKENQQK